MDTVAVLTDHMAVFFGYKFVDCVSDMQAREPWMESPGLYDKLPH